MSYTLGGPIVIPKVVDGRNKLFFFANYSFVADLIPGNIQTGAITIPKGPATFQKRVFPFRIDGVRGRCWAVAVR